MSRPFAGNGAEAPIGVFDSGLGGLTVVRALREKLPYESLLYFGDTARVPYGPKSPETVRRYALQIGEWLVEQGVKAVVVACNTATAHGLEHLRAALPVPVIGVVEPGARAAVEAIGSDGTRQIGVIGTSGTIASGAYERAIHALSAKAVVVAQACPLFVPFVEEGWTDHDATRLVAEEYLAPLRHAGVDALVMGCTHYPLLTRVIAHTMGSRVRLIDSGHETALETERLLTVLGLRRAEPTTSHDRPGASQSATRLRVVVSDAPQRFLPLANRFLNDGVDGIAIGDAAQLTDIEQLLFS